MINTEFSNDQNERTTSKFFNFGIGYFVYKVQFFPYQHRYICSPSLMFTQMVNGSHIKSYIGAMH